MIEERPCKITDLIIHDHSKKEYYHKIIVRANNIFTYALHEIVYDRNEEISVPEVLQAQYSLTYMDKESRLMILIDDKGQVRDNLKFPTDLWLAEE